MALLVAFTTAVLQQAQAKRQQFRGYEKALFESRLAVYPELFKHLSAYAKLITYEKNNHKNLERFRDDLDDWNSANSLLFTVQTSRISSRFRHYLRLVLSDDRELSDDEWKTVRQAIAAFESALKAEIGILDTDPVGSAPQKVLGAERMLKEEIRHYQSSART